MKRYLSLLLCLVLALGLAVPAWADGESYEMLITRTEKLVYRAGQVVGQPISGECNAKLYDVIDLPLHDRELFDTVKLSFVDTEDGLSMTAQELIGHNAYTYTSSAPEVCFLLSGTELLPTGNGEAEIVAYDALGEEVDRFTVTVSGGSSKRIIAPCSKCGVDQGTVLHLMECGHFSCETGAAGHGKGKCAVTGHYNCDGKDHGLCSNCLSWLCTGEHGEGICQHVHSWNYVSSANYWPYCEPGVPMRICSTCGAREYQYCYNPYYCYDPYYYYYYYGYPCYPYYAPCYPYSLPVPSAP